MAIKGRREPKKTKIPSRSAVVFADSWSGPILCSLPSFTFFPTSSTSQNCSQNTPQMLLLIPSSGLSFPRTSNILRLLCWQEKEPYFYALLVSKKCLWGDILRDVLGSCLREGEPQPRGNTLGVATLLPLLFFFFAKYSAQGFLVIIQVITDFVLQCVWDVPRAASGSLQSEFLYTQFCDELGACASQGSRSNSMGHRESLGILFFEKGFF